MRASVVVVAFGQRAVTAAFLERWAQVAPDAELVLVDNGSPDDTLTLFDAWRDRATVVALPENRNFSGGCNAGAGAARGDALVFLNNDCLVEPGVVEALADEVLVAGAAVAGPRLLYPDGTVQHAGVGMAGTANGLAVPHHLFHGAPGGLGAAQVVVELDCVTGACLAIGRERFTALGGFDEAFANGWEDVDLCLRVRASGGRVVYRGDLTLVHDEGRTRGAVRDDVGNQTVFYRRWGALLGPDDELIARVWDAQFGWPARHAARPGEPASVVVRGDAFGIGPFSDQVRALLAALERRGERPALEGGVPLVLVPHLTEPELALVARAAGRLAQPGLPLLDAAAEPVCLPDVTTLRGGAREGTIAVLPAHDLAAAARVLDAAGPHADLLPTAATDALHALAGRPLLAPIASEPRLAALLARYETVLCEDPADPFERVARLAAATAPSLVG